MCQRHSIYINYIYLHSKHLIYTYTAPKYPLWIKCKNDTLLYFRGTLYIVFIRIHTYIHINMYNCMYIISFFAVKIKHKVGKWKMDCHFPAAADNKCTQNITHIHVIKSYIDWRLRNFLHQPHPSHILISFFILFLFFTQKKLHNMICRKGCLVLY